MSKQSPKEKLMGRKFDCDCFCDHVDGGRWHSWERSRESDGSAIITELLTSANSRLFRFRPMPWGSRWVCGPTDGADALPVALRSSPPLCRASRLSALRRWQKANPKE